MAWKFVNSVSPKWPQWTSLLTDFFMKPFSTSNIEIVKSCQELFAFELPSTLVVAFLTEPGRKSPLGKIPTSSYDDVIMTSSYE